jgi:hypothetical protein
MVDLEIWKYQYWYAVSKMWSVEPPNVRVRVPTMRFTPPRPRGAVRRYE